MPAIRYLDTITQKGRRTEHFYPHSTPSQSSVSTDSLLPTLDLGDPPYFDNNATLQMKRRLAAILCTPDQLTITRNQQKEFYRILRRPAHAPLNYWLDDFERSRDQGKIMQEVLDELEHQTTKLRNDIQHHKKRAAKSMQAAFTLGRASHVLGKFILDDALFPPERKDAIYDEGDLLPVYMHGKGTREDPCYFDEELPSDNDDDDDEEMKDNKIDEENKENIPDNEPPRASASNKDAQTLPAQEEKEYSWTSDSDKRRVAIMNHIWSYEGKDHKIFDCPHYTCGECGKQAPGHGMVECENYFCKRCQEPAPGHNWWSCGEEGSDKQGPESGIA